MMQTMHTLGLINNVNVNITIKESLLQAAHQDENPNHELAGWSKLKSAEPDQWQDNDGQVQQRVG